MLAVTILVAPLAVEAQQAGKVPSIGILGAPSQTASRIQEEAFRQGLREFGYVEGQNIAIVGRYAEGNLDLLPRLAAELVRLKVDVILAPS